MIPTVIYIVTFHSPLLTTYMSLHVECHLTLDYKRFAMYSHSHLGKEDTETWVKK
jgi:hypothetical protein